MNYRDMFWWVLAGVCVVVLGAGIIWASYHESDKYVNEPTLIEKIEDHGKCNSSDIGSLCGTVGSSQ